MPGRKLSQFKTFNPNPLHELKWDDMREWILHKKKQFLSYRCAGGEGDLSDCDATDCSDTDTD